MSYRLIGISFVFSSENNSRRQVAPRQGITIVFCASAWPEAKPR
jgi:hypothetical protein